MIYVKHKSVFIILTNFVLIFLSDMAGFAFSVDLLVSRGGNASMPYWVGHEEDEFIKSLGVEYQDLEPRFGNKSNSVFAFFS